MILKMLNNRYSLIAPGVCFAVAVACVVGLDNTGRTWIALAAFMLPGLISIFLSGVCRSGRKTLSYLLYGAGLLMFLVFVFLILRNSTDMFGFMSRKAVEYVVVIPWCATSILILITGIPLALRVRDETEWTGTDEDVDQEPDLAPIGQALDKLTGLSQMRQEAIRREAHDISDAAENVRSTLTAQEGRVKRLREELTLARQEAQKYKAIANGKRSAVPRYQLHQYRVGFVTGLLSSALVQILAILIRKLIE